MAKSIMDGLYDQCGNTGCGKCEDCCPQQVHNYQVNLSNKIVNNRTQILHETLKLLSLYKQRLIDLKNRL